MPDLFESARRVPDHCAPPKTEWSDDAKDAVAALQEEIEIRDSAHEQCLADLEWSRNSLAQIVRDGVPEWSRFLFHEVLRRIDRNI
jgi:hypothetical protein